MRNLHYSIGVVTYLGRFEKYFIPLVKRLARVFPDKEVICFLNGHYDVNLQIHFLRNVTSFLSQYPNIRYITNERHQPLAKGWNWTILMSSNPLVLILNDDVEVDDLFRFDLEHELSRRQDVSLFTINRSWSHFVISKRLVKRIGWFDERFLGIGMEDGDYMCRMAYAGITEIEDVQMRGSVNYVADQPKQGWLPDLGTVSGKYTKANRDFFVEKWHFSDFEPSPMTYKVHFNWKHENYGAALKEEMETPCFYDLALMDEPSPQHGFRICIYASLMRALSNCKAFAKRCAILAKATVRRLGF